MEPGAFKLCVIRRFLQAMRQGAFKLCVQPSKALSSYASYWIQQLYSCPTLGAISRHQMRSACDLYVATAQWHKLDGVERKL